MTPCVSFTAGATCPFSSWRTTPLAGSATFASILTTCRPPRHHGPNWAGGGLPHGVGWRPGTSRTSTLAAACRPISMWQSPRPSASDCLKPASALSVVGGVMAYPNREFLETSAASGLSGSRRRVQLPQLRRGGGHASGGRGLSPVACEIRPWRDAALAHRVRPALDAQYRPAAHRPGPEKRSTSS